MSWWRPTSRREDWTSRSCPWSSTTTCRSLPKITFIASVAQGGSVFRLQCAACHAWAGDGGALLHREAPALHEATPTQIAEAVRVGPGAMPAFGTAALTDGQLADLVAYVRYLDHPKDRGGWTVYSPCTARTCRARA